MRNLYLLALLLLFPLTSHAVSLEPILSSKDVATYRQLFHLQRSLKREEASQLADEIENPILMGHVIATRLLHPQTRTPYKDLQAWLNLYNDLPEAGSIYELANKRAPQGATHKAPRYNNRSVARYTDLNTILPKPAPAPKPSSVRPKLEARLKKNLAAQKYDESLKLLLKDSARIILGGEDWLDACLDLAKPLMAAERYTEAHHLMGLAGKYQTSKRPQALWMSGLAAYQGGFLDAAVQAFRALTYTTPKGSNAYTRAAWWSGRTYQELNNPKLADVFFQMAADHPTTFYGQLAVDRLTHPHKVAWKRPTPNPEDVVFLSKQPAIQRTIALAQVGEFTLAQNELKNIYTALPNTMDETLLSLALALHLPNMAFNLALNLQQKGKTFLPGLYPAPTRWRPIEGYQIDPSLLLAIMRQESAFDPTTVSHAGARGLMQIMPATAEDIRRRNKLFTLPLHFLDKPAVSLSLAQEYLQHLHERFEGNVVYMLTAYNAGPGNLNKWLSKPDMATLDPVLFIERIPFTETRQYVKRVLANLWLYRTRFDQPSPTRLALALYTWPHAIALAPNKRKEG